MTKQKSPHSQTKQNITPEHSDYEPDEIRRDEEVYRLAQAVGTGADRAPRKVESRSKRRATEPPDATYEGSVSTRTPKRPVQGITSHSAQQESERQGQVVKDRPDAQAGVNRSRRKNAI